MVNLKNRSLYFTNRKLYYKKKSYSQRAKKGWITRKANIQRREREEETGKVKRYSVSFMMVRGGEYGKTLRAIIIDPQPVARRKLIIGELKERLERKMQKEGVWGIPKAECFEKEDIDLVEAQGLLRNEIFFEGFENA